MGCNFRWAVIWGHNYFCPLGSKFVFLFLVAYMVAINVGKRKLLTSLVVSFGQMAFHLSFYKFKHLCGTNSKGDTGIKLKVKGALVACSLSETFKFFFLA